MKKYNTIKRFELNKAALKDFDTLMSMNLGEVEELIVTELDKDMKILNIISLCLNVKTLVIEGNPRMDVNAILTNICKPNKVTSIVIRNVKLPNEKVMKKFTNLRIISISDIRFSNIGAFINSVANPERVEGISFIGVDFAGLDIDVLKVFKNVKILNLKRLNNCRFANLCFIKELEKLTKITLKDSIIKAEDLNGIKKGKFEKDVLLEIENEVDSAVKDYIQINDEDGISIKVNSASLDTIVNKVSFYKLDKLILIVDNENNIDEYIKKLKKIKNKIDLEVKDFSYISAKDAQVFSERLKINTINILDEEKFLDYRKTKNRYTIEEYIEIKNILDKFVNKALEYETELEQFLCAYREIGLYLEKDYNVETAEKDVSVLLNMLTERKTFRQGYAEVLQNVLATLGIEACYVKGTVDGESHLWNKVCIDGVWYNVDLEQDKDAISKKGIFGGRVEYCLVSDEMFLKTHTPESTNKNFAPKTVDVKIVRTAIRKLKNYVPKKEKVQVIESVAEEVQEISEEVKEEIIEEIQELQEDSVEYIVNDFFADLEEDVQVEKKNGKKSKIKKAKSNGEKKLNSFLMIIEKIKNICMHNRVKTLPEGRGDTNIKEK